MIAQIVHLAANRFHAGQLRVAVTFLGDQLAPHRWRCQPRVQPLGLKRGIRLTLGVHEGSNVGEQMRQVFLAPFASACGEGIHAGDASSQFVHAFLAAPTGERAAGETRELCRRIVFPQNERGYNYSPRGRERGHPHQPEASARERSVAVGGPR